MPPIGETLREARMRQRLDIADVETRTKIRAKYLRALENEEWGLLPGPTFVKTFLRTYAEVVGVDPHLLVEEYRTTHEPHDDDMEAQPFPGPPAASRRGESRRRTPPGPPSRGAVAAGLVVVVVGFLLVLGLVSGDDGDSGSKRASGEAHGTTETAARRQARPEPQPKPPPPAPKGVAVRIEPATPTYACIDTGEGTGVVFEGILEGARTFKNPSRLRLNLGKRALGLRVNGKAVKVTPGPDPVGFDLTPKATKEIPEGTRPCA